MQTRRATNIILNDYVRKPLSKFILYCLKDLFKENDKRQVYIGMRIIYQLEVPDNLKKEYISFLI